MSILQRSTSAAQALGTPGRTRFRSAPDRQQDHVADLAAAGCGGLEPLQQSLHDLAERPSKSPGRSGGRRGPDPGTAIAGCNAKTSTCRARAGSARQHAQSELRGIAYFSMEFGLAEALPIYSGGLGILAGDHLKSASDLNVPVVGIGLLYQQGYFRQVLADDGWQLEAFPFNDPGSLPITPVLDADGRWPRVRLELPGRTLYLAGLERPRGKGEPVSVGQQSPLEQPLGPRHHGQPLRGREGEAAAPGTGAGRRRLAAAGEAGDRRPGLPHERRSCGLCRAGPRAELRGKEQGSLPGGVAGHAGGQRVHDPHPRGSRLRPLRAGPGHQVRRAFRARDGALRRGLSRLGTPRPGRCRRAVQHGLPGDARQLPRQRRGPLARQGQPAAVPGAVPRLARRGGPRQFRHQRRAHSHLAFRAGQPALERRPTAWTGRGWATWGRRPRGSSRSPTSGSGTIAPRPARRSSTTSASGLQRQLRERNAPEAAIQKAQHVLDPNRITLGFARRFAEYKRPNLLAGRPGAVQSAFSATRSGRCRSSSPASPTRTTTAARPWCSGWSSSRGATTSATTSSSWRTTTWCWPSILPRASTCGSTTPAGRPRPAAPAA